MEALIQILHCYHQEIVAIASVLSALFFLISLMVSQQTHKETLEETKKQAEERKEEFNRQMEISKQTHEETLKETKKQAEERKEEFNRQMEFEKTQFLWEKRMEFLEKTLKEMEELRKNLYYKLVMEMQKFLHNFFTDPPDTREECKKSKSSFVFIMKTELMKESIPEFKEFFKKDFNISSEHKPTEEERKKAWEKMNFNPEIINFFKEAYLSSEKFDTIIEEFKILSLDESIIKDFVDVKEKVKKIYDFLRKIEGEFEKMFSSISSNTAEEYYTQDEIKRLHSEKNTSSEYDVSQPIKGFIYKTRELDIILLEKLKYIKENVLIIQEFYKDDTGDNMIFNPIISSRLKNIENEFKKYMIEKLKL